MRLQIGIIGGDNRQGRLAQLLETDGHEVRVFGAPLPEGSQFREAQSLEETVNGAQCVVLPIPAVRDCTTINIPSVQRPYTAEQLFSILKTGQIVVGGKIPEAMFESAHRNAIDVVDYAEREDFSVRNAVPSAEGALQLAMENTQHTIHGSRCLVIGYGRIGNVLARMLRALGAHVTVAARRYSDFSWIKVEGYQMAHTMKLSGRLSDLNIIFNTVPRLVLGEAEIAQLPKGCLLIDLASFPGGIDYDAAQKQGVPCLWALGLPGKVAPVSASLILKDCIYNILEERGCLYE